MPLLLADMAVVTEHMVRALLPHPGMVVLVVLTIAKVFQLQSEWQGLKHRAQASFIREALKARGITMYVAAHVPRHCPWQRRAARAPPAASFVDASWSVAPFFLMVARDSSLRTGSWRKVSSLKAFLSSL